MGLLISIWILLERKKKKTEVYWLDKGKKNDLTISKPEMTKLSHLGKTLIGSHMWEWTWVFQDPLSPTQWGSDESRSPKWHGKISWG